MTGKYFVIVFPPPPATRGPGMQGAGSTTVATPRVVKVEARFPADAAAAADVQPGGHCIVVVGGARFDRAAQAPLEEKALDGNPLPENADAA